MSDIEPEPDVLGRFIAYADHLDELIGARTRPAYAETCCCGASVLVAGWLAEAGAKLPEIDRNARAYGWEVGQHGTLVEVVEHTCPDNPFMDADWRAALAPSAPPDAHSGDLTASDDAGEASGHRDDTTAHSGDYERASVMAGPNAVRVWRDRAGDWQMTCETHLSHATCGDQPMAFEAALGHVAYWHHEHVWQRRQNMTGRGSASWSTYDACECGAARAAEPVHLTLGGRFDQ